MRLSFDRRTGKLILSDLTEAELVELAAIIENWVRRRGGAIQGLPKALQVQELVLKIGEPRRGWFKG